MRLLILAPVLAIALLGASSALPTSAAPDNKNTETIDVSCDEPIGDITITTMPNESVTAFGPDGRVFVVKGFSFESELTIEIEDGPTFEFEEEEEDLVPGKGFQGRLIECSFTEEFTEEHTLDEETLPFLEEMTGEELDEFLGATVTFSGTFTGTAHVLTPGR